jgi:hypothetical protein
MEENSKLISEKDKKVIENILK